MKNIFILLLVICKTAIYAQVLHLPLEKNNFTKITTYDELSDFVMKLDQGSDHLVVETIGNSVEGRNIYAMKFSTSDFGKDKSKIKVLIFAQQHGNEQSGKEGALLLARDLLLPENNYLFTKIDLVIVPQVNPDGSEVNQRRNANNTDLNRNHLILTEPETQALHQLFDRYLFEASLDVHEYYPWDSAWIELGFRKNTDVTFGGTTNINVSERIRKLTNKKAIPYFKKRTAQSGFTTFEYCPGGPPGKHYIRRSTFDINDGRQSLGIQHTLSFIQEGMNGYDGYADNIGKRAQGQANGMRSFLEYVYRNHSRLKRMIAKERKKLTEPESCQVVAIQMQHSHTGEKLKLPVYSYLSNTDTVIVVDDFRPVVTSSYAVNKPAGYLVPIHLAEVIAWAKRQNLVMMPFDSLTNVVLEQYFIRSVDSTDFEGDVVIDPDVDASTFQLEALDSDYIYIPTAQLKGNMIVTALEPGSMLGLATYPLFSYLIRAGETYPVLRVYRDDNKVTK